MNRSGAALIIAMTVLAALLLLALPFIFSQSSSMAGARAAAWDGVARRGADRAQGLATALGAYATGLHRSPGLVAQLGVAQQAYVQIPVQVQVAVGYYGFADTAWRSVLDSRAEWPTNDGDLPALDTAGALHGAIIEDESRRLDPNTLGERGWAIVLARAGIRDPHTVAWRWGSLSPGPNPPTSPTNLSSVGYWEMVRFGRLARALSWWRPTNSGRFNRLEDLLGADPNEPRSPAPRTLGCTDFGPAGYDRATGAANWPAPATSEAVVESTRNAAESDAAVKAVTGEALFDAVNGDNRGYRVAPLTQAELERLRPLLSFLNPGQGRSGLIDVGTVVAEAPESYHWYGVTTDELSPAAMGVGPSLRPHDSVRIRSQSNPGGRDLNNRWTAVGDALAIESLPWLNLNAVPSTSGLVRLFSQSTPADPGWPADPTATPTTSIGAIGRLAWLDGRVGDGVESFERPAIGIQGFGILAIEGAAAALDPQAAATAQRRKRTVVQAVAQERPVEATWRTQGEFEALLAQRHGSWVIAGPHPTRRIKDWGEVAGDMAALDGAGWLEPAPLASFTRSTAATFDWRVPFGLTKAQSWDDVLRPVDANGNPDTGVTPATSPVLRASGVTVGALTAQGLRLDDVGLAYDSTSSAGPLRFNGGGYEELRPRHLTMRFCLPTAPGGNVILAEARNQVDPQLYDHRGRPPVPADAAANTAAAGSTNLWRIEYRPASQMLVLVIANAALPWTVADRERHGVDAWTSGADTDPSAAIDPRSGPDPALPFAPRDPATTVEFRYKVAGGLVQGRWYHLQAFCASDRPGLHGLTLDGLVGRDATRPGVDMTRTGDHYTFPSLRLDETSAIARSINVTGSSLAVTDLAVTYPADLDLVDLLPARGVVRIDDEFFSYTGLSGSAGTGMLTGVQRGRRQNTNQMMTEDLDGNGILTSSEDLDGDGILDSGEDANGNGRLDSAEDVNSNGILDTVDDYRRWPITQKHNAGTLVVPGWSQFEITSGRWLRGDVTLEQAEGLPAAGLATATAEASQLTLDADADGRPEFTTAVTTLAIVPTGTWSPQGFVLIDVPGVGVARAFYTLAGTTLTLDWTAGTGIRPISGELSSGATEMQLRQVSLKVDGVVDPIPGIGFVAGDDPLLGPIADPPGLQLLDSTDGTCEWIRYHLRVSRAEGNFFIHDSGWTPPPVPPQPAFQARGAMRTTTRSWPQGARILPVQTQIPVSDRFESGDVATVVAEQIEPGAPVPRRDPVQIVVRHAARDGYPAARAQSGPAYDTKNEWFALAHAIPDALPDPSGAPAAPQTVLIGRGWGGDDLSPVGNSPSRRGAMPRRPLLAPAGVGGVARTFLGSADPRSMVTQDVLIDDLCAGVLSGLTDANVEAQSGAVRGCELIAFTSPSGTALDGIDATASALPVDVTASVNVFTRINNQTYGLCRIDDEVFAYRWISNTQVRLIARALLGSEAQEHRVQLDSADAPALVPTVANGLPDRAVRPTLPVVRLPLGPVGELCSPLAVGDQGTALDVVELPFGDYYRDPTASGFTNSYQGTYARTDWQHLDEAPFVLLNDPAGAAAPEVLRLLGHPTQANQYTTARWLRGLYGTAAQPWTPGFANPATRPATWINQDVTAYVPTLTDPQPAGALNPIVIAWWPRFAPGLPATLPAADTAAALRSRSFAWAGFPLRLAGARFDPAIPALTAANGGIADLPVPQTTGNDLLAMALAAGDGAAQLFDWDQAYANVHTLTTTGTALTRPFNWSRFTLREVDGAEMRVHWRPQSSGLTGIHAAADAAGRAPRLGATDDEAKAAPTATAGVRLRCMAPTRVLAVEEVR